MKKKDGNYEIGYGKPPRKTQFQKGKSGNPRGRPRGSRNSSTLMKKALSDKVAVRENGRTRTISKLQAIITQTVNKAATGDHRAREFLFSKIPWLLNDLIQPAGPRRDPVEIFREARRLLRGDPDEPIDNTTDVRRGVKDVDPVDFVAALKRAADMN